MTENSIEKDAARYRWLRDRAQLDERDGATNGAWRISGIPAYDLYEKAPFDHKTFDGAVDAAASLTPPAPAVESAQVKEGRPDG